MNSSSYYFPDVTLLITHYNRSNSIERLFKAFKEQNCSFEHIIVSDDASKPEHLEKLELLKDKYNFQILAAKKNGGLGNNINKGQDAVKTAYTFFVQDDFYPTSAFSENFSYALKLMQTEKQWDLIRFYSFPWAHYPNLKPYKANFSEMIFRKNPLFNNYFKFFVYSDHPHLRRSNFLDKFGRYVEGKHVYETEWQMCLSFLSKKGRGLLYDGTEAVFHHENTEDEPASEGESKGGSWRKSKTSLVLLLRAIYLKARVFKKTYELMLYR